MLASRGVNDDENARQLFEGWVSSLTEGRRDRLSKHIASARAGAPWVRQWLPAVDRDAGIMSAADFAEWNPEPSLDEPLSEAASAAPG